MTTGPYHTLQEILSEPSILGTVIDQAWDAYHRALAGGHALDAQEVIFTGCGSTHYAACAAARAYQDLTGRRARALPASELWLFPEGIEEPSDTLLVVLSRSGETTESLRALTTLKDRGIRSVLGITCDPGSSLARQADVSLAFAEAAERSVAQTRSFVAMLVAAFILPLVITRDEDRMEQMRQVPELLRRVIDDHHGTVHQVVDAVGLERAFCLGSGPYYGIACEASLKMKEMALVPSEAFYSLEFRHGPISLVDEKTLVVGLVTEKVADHELQVLKDVKRVGGNILMIADSLKDLDTGDVDYRIELRSGLDPVVRAPLMLSLLQRLAYEETLRRGLNPDEPRHLSQVVTL